jgi:hypothetical protein
MRSLGHPVRTTAVVVGAVVLLVVAGLAGWRASHDRRDAAAPGLSTAARQKIAERELRRIYREPSLDHGANFVECAPLGFGLGEHPVPDDYDQRIAAGDQFFDCLVATADEAKHYTTFVAVTAQGESVVDP